MAGYVPDSPPVGVASCSDMGYGNRLVWVGESCADVLQHEQGAYVALEALHEERSTAYWLLTISVKFPDGKM